VAVSIAERKSSVELLLTDVAMPDVDGPTLAAKILTIHANAKVIFMSGSGLETCDAEKIAEAGFLPKPFSSRMLFDVIDRALGAGLQTSSASSTGFSF